MLYIELLTSNLQPIILSYIYNKEDSNNYYEIILSDRNNVLEFLILMMNPKYYKFYMISEDKYKMGINFYLLITKYNSFLKNIIKYSNINDI